MYSISIFIVTYKQENLIGRAIESVLAQRDWGLKSIVIGDDCSPDNNWKVIQEYQGKYPDIIKAYRNEHNLGIYGNYEQLLSHRDEADLYYFLEGDDAICDGWFKAIQENLTKRKVKVKDEAAAVCSDYKVIRPNGMSLTNRNNRLVEKKEVDVVSLKARNIITYRSTMVTAKTLERYTPVDLSKGLGIAEEMADIRAFRFSDKFYYVPFVATIYYTHIGISTRLNTDEYYDEKIKQYRWMQDALPLDNKAKRFCQFYVTQNEFKKKPTWDNYKKMFQNYWIAFDCYTLYGACFIMNLLLWVRMLKLLIKRRSKN